MTLTQYGNIQEWIEKGCLIKYLGMKHEVQMRVRLLFMVEKTNSMHGSGWGRGVVLHELYMNRLPRGISATAILGRGLL